MLGKETLRDFILLGSPKGRHRPFRDRSSQQGCDIAQLVGCLSSMKPREWISSRTGLVAHAEDPGTRRGVLGKYLTSGLIGTEKLQFLKAVSSSGCLKGRLPSSMVRPRYHDSADHLTSSSLPERSPNVSPCPLSLSQGRFRSSALSRPLAPELDLVSLLLFNPLWSKQ